MILALTMPRARTRTPSVLSNSARFFGDELGTGVLAVTFRASLAFAGMQALRKRKLQLLLSSAATASPGNRRHGHARWHRDARVSKRSTRPGSLFAFRSQLSVELTRYR